MARANPQRSKENPISHRDFSARTFRVVTMIHRFPHTSDGAARFRLQSLDLQCWQVNGRWRPAGCVPPVRGRAANRTATSLLLNLELACASVFYKSAYWRVFLTVEKIQGESVPFFQSIIHTKHPVPLTEMSRAPGAFLFFKKGNVLC